MKTKKKKTGIKLSLILLSFVSVLVANTVMIELSSITLKNSLNDQALNGLSMLAEAVRAGYDNMEGQYTLDGNGQLWKGDLNLSEQVALIDNYVKNSEADVTVCYGKTRILTTLVDTSTKQRIIGTDIADEVWKTISKGETYTVKSIPINGEDYIACYIPLRDSDGSIIGAVFAGKPRADIRSNINKLNGLVSGVGVTLLLIFGVSGFILSSRIAGRLTKATEALQRLAEGKLDTRVAEDVMKRGDEIGDIGRATTDLIRRLREIVEKLLKTSGDLFETGNSLDTMAASSNIATNEISRAVNGISKGAISQAEEIESASVQITSIGELIDEIVDNVGNLTRISNDMSAAGEASTKTMVNLSESNDRTSEAITSIGRQIRLTDESIKRISEATDLITSIASQTNLLSLNASIESARAGEAGKGFAVVASEIQKLAVQSSDAAVEIQQIINTLQSESTRTMREMQAAEALMKEQQDKLDETRAKFDEVSGGIKISREGTEQIRVSADSCGSARTAVIDVFSNLSAISEENAASTEETNASMQELNATLNLLANEAGKLKDISQALNDYMQFFQM